MTQFKFCGSSNPIDMNESVYLPHHGHTPEMHSLVHQHCCQTNLGYPEHKESSKRCNTACFVRVFYGSES